MVKYIGEKDYEHGSKEKIGVLITNLGMVLFVKLLASI